MSKEAWKSVITLLITILTIIAGTLGVESAVADPDTKTKVKVVEMEVPAAPPATAVDGPDADGKQDDALPLNPEAQQVLEDVTQKPRAEFDDPLREKEDNDPVGVYEGPLAAQDFPGCRVAFVRNYSSRNGIGLRIIVWHYTVSRERGLASQNALTAYANNPASGVSWHFLIGRSNGMCTYTVPLTMKAWHGGNANPFSAGIEVEAYGDEGVYVKGKGERKLLSVTREIGRRYSIPMRRGLVRNCQPVRSGIVTHADLGACGGGHHDIGPFKDADRLIKALGVKPCGTVCKRRKEHTIIHTRLRATCRTKAQVARHPASCKKLRGQNVRLHRQGL